MKKITAVTALLVLGVFLEVGCSTKTDPFDGQPDWVQRAIKPGADRQATAILGDDKILINSDSDKFVFTAGSAAQYRFQVRVLEEGYVGDVIVANLADFKDATLTQDQQDWVFAWTPDPDAPSSSQFLRIEVRAHLACPPGDQTKCHTIVQMKREKMTVEVKAVVGPPDVLTANGIPDDIHEGEHKDFSIDVHNVNTSKTPPTLQFLPGDVAVNNTHIDVSAFLQAGSPTQDTKDLHLWHFPVTINLRDANLTLRGRTSTVGVFKVAAVSAQLLSAPKSFEIDVYPTVAKPLATVKDYETFKVKVGTEWKQAMVFFDPTGRGKMEVEVVTSPLPKGLTIDCPTGWSNRWMVTCKAEWKVDDKEEPASHDIKLKATNSAASSYDKTKKSADFNITIKVVK
jgi:hypothetical protein